ncbi:MAG: SpoIIE family protein phosphatase [Bacteroidia bacterium]|nr:SpoIIE family protein phosphatase [Bacteroidia bacterium]
MGNKAIIRLTSLGAAIAWIILFFSDLTILFSDTKGLAPGIPLWLPGVMLDIYLIMLYYHYKFRIEKDENLNFTDLLWKVFATGLIVTVVSLSIRFVIFLLGNTTLPGHILFGDSVYLINLSLFFSFLVAAYTSWKRLIIYQKSKWLIRTWRVFEFLLLFVLIYDSLRIELNEGIFIMLMIILGLIALVLSANMKWVAYLNFKQKWTSLLLLLLTLFYLGYFFYTVSRQSDIISEASTSFLDFRSHIFNISLFGFVMMYSIFSFLVILFNLPTSSVFEQKLEEVVNFQRLSQSIQTEQSEESVYNILLESSVSSVFADAAWLEIRGTNQDTRLFSYQISEKDALEITNHIKNQNIKGVLDQGSDKTRNLSKYLASLKGGRFRSVLAFPILVKGESIGTLALLKELPEGFTKEMTRIISTFANQAGISIENFRLLEEAFQNERYKEELKIAKTVQKSLLPQKLEQDMQYDIAAFSRSADEVGGDYYDTLRINDHEVAMIIADVSGKGTTAAFHMSQMKGIFHSLAQQQLDPKEFMVRANMALKHCLERGSFISATYFVVDSKEKKIYYARAGHCPVLYYNSSTSKAEYLKDKGTALGMIKTKDYCNFIETYELPYASGDIMILYTDGVTEAKDKKGAEFDYDRLKQTVEEVTDKSPKEIQEHLIKKLYEYSGTDEINDDYTTMIVKFN